MYEQEQEYSAPTERRRNYDEPNKNVNILYQQEEEEKAMMKN